MMPIVWIFLWALTIVHGEESPMCQTCSCKTEDAQIMTIDCRNKNLHHIYGEWSITNDTKILKISYAGNDILTLEPMPSTEAVVEVIFSRCNIKYLEPALFANAKNVKFVDFSHNELSAAVISSEKFKGPYNDSSFEPIALEHLDLSYNQIHSLGKNVFEHMPNLKTLNLEGNDFTVLDIHTQLALSSIRRLQDLNLANNELTELIGGAIEAHENLTRMNLSLNSLDFVPSSLAEIGKSLEVLILDGNPIIDFVAESFLGLGNITELYANNLTKLKYINGNTFAAMPKLKKLSLENNMLLKDIDREAFGVNQSLEEFYLKNNDLYRLDYKLLPWSKLHVFEFKENPLDCSCDLYNITRDLSAEITRQEDGPFCLDPRNERYTRVFYLKSDICVYKGLHFTHKDSIEHRFSLLRIVLIVLSIVVMVGALLAAALGYIRYKKYQRALSYPFASQVSYNPVDTSPKY